MRRRGRPGGPIFAVQITHAARACACCAGGRRNPACAASSRWSSALASRIRRIKSGVPRSRPLHPVGGPPHPSVASSRGSPTCAASSRGSPAPLDSTGEPAGQLARLMPYVVIGTKVSLRSVSAGIARAGLPYFAAWPQALGERPQRGVHLHDSGRGGSVTYYIIHGPTAPPAP